MKTISEELKYSGKYIRIYDELVDLGGGVLDTFEYVWRLDGTRTIAIDKNSRILLTDEYRPELRDRDWRVPGGKLDYEHEDLETAAKREFEQETGFKGKRWQYLWSTTPDSFIRYRRHFFLATGIEPGKASKEMGEDIKPHWLPLQEAYKMALQGDIREEISALSIMRLLNELKEKKREVIINDDLR